MTTADKTRATSLPAPRLQLRWVDGATDGEFLCHYELVLPLQEYDIRREGVDGKPACSEAVYQLGKTRMEGPRPDKRGEVDAPYRDGAHAKWDALHLGNLPIFAIYGSSVTRLNRGALVMALDRHLAAVEALGKVKDGKTLFEGSPTKDEECFRAWTELNDAGAEARAALAKVEGN